MTTPRPTLLVFTLGARGDRRRHPLLPARHGAEEVELRRACLRAALDAGRWAGCRVVVSSPAPLDLPAGVERIAQHGRGFGRRLEHACREAATPGAPLLVVGADVPGLTAATLRRALAALEREPAAVVLGPSPDGGFHLLASRGPLDGLAERTRWCRRDTLRRLRRSLRAAGRPVILTESLADLDHRADLEGWLSAARRGARGLGATWRRLLRRLAHLLATLRRAPAAPTPVRRPPPAVAVCAPRGPPRAR